MADAVHVEGLREFVRGVKSMDKAHGKAVRLALNDAANVIVDEARPRVAKRSGRAAGTVKARSTQTAARVVGGGNRAPYYPWLDFGGAVGRKHSVKRPFFKDGRYIYAAYGDNKGAFIDKMVERLVEVAQSAGVEVT